MEPDQLPVEHTWTARRVRPVVTVYVAGVFAGFMALAQFVFHSAEAVKALMLAGFGGLASLVPSVLTQVEYKLTATGLKKRGVQKKKPEEFRDVFSWDDLDYVVFTSTGFKFYKQIRTSQGLTRFLKLHLSGDHSGEVPVTPGDRLDVRGILENRSIPTSRPLSR